MKFIDMFCGIGTIRMGFEQAGHECVYSIEWDKHKRRIYSVIFGKEPEGQDIRGIRGTQLPRADCWSFGSPCQDLSVAGKRKGIIKGERSSMYFEVMRQLSEIKEEDRPTYLLFENVKGLFSSNGGRDFLEVLYQMDSYGYDTEWQLINSKWFVPQNRERIFVVGHLRGRSTRKVFPITKSSGLYNEAGQSGEKLHETALCLTAKGQTNWTGSFVLKQLIPGRVGKGIANTLDTSCNQGTLIQSRIRRLTPRECMRLQGVSDEVTDKLIAAGISDTQMYRGAGDACTVPVIYEIAKRMK